MRLGAFRLHLVAVSDPQAVDPRSFGARIAAGDTWAYEQLFDAYYEPLRRYAYRFLRSSEEAEDLVHDVFLRIWDRRTELVSIGDLASYLYTATRHGAINRLRRRRVEERGRERLAVPELSVGEAALPADPEQLLAEREISAALQRAIDELPTRQREVTLLRWRQHSYDEIADRLGISPKTVAAHLARALDHLRKTLPDLLA